MHKERIFFNMQSSHLFIFASNNATIPMKKNCFQCLLLVISVFVLASCEPKAPLPNIDITSSSIPYDHKIPCFIYYSENGDILKENAKVKWRGGFSCVYPKKSYTFKMDHKVALAGLPKQRAYILNANYIDKTMMRHKICFDLFREMNPEKNLASQCAYVTVSLNGSYNGLYVLMQKLNAGSLGLDKTDTMAMIFKDPPLFRGENRLEPQWVQEPGNYFQQNYPDIENKDRNGYLEELMQFMIHADDSTFAQEIGHYFDLDNIIDWQLLLMLSDNGDGVLKNFYLYKRDSFTPFRIAIWDYDDTFGRDGTGELKPAGHLPDFERSLIINKLQNNPYLNYNTLLKQRYKVLRDSGVFSKKHIETMIHDNDRIIQQELARNFQRWPVNRSEYKDSNSYEDEIKIMRNFLKIHIPFLDKEMGYDGK